MTENRTFPFSIDLRRQPFSLQRMSKICHSVCVAIPASKRRTSFAMTMSWLSGLVAAALLMAVWPARADGPDDDYPHILNIIQQADALNDSGKAAPAKAKYQEAQAALRTFQKDNPDWNASRLIRSNRA